jgi:hypothetical protein
MFRNIKIIFNLIFMIVATLIGCGGGTYGTGGEEERSIINVINQQAYPLANAKIKVAGIKEESVTNQDGNASIILNEQLPTQIIRVQSENQSIQDFYIESSGNSQLELVFSDSADEATTQTAKFSAKDSCQERLDFWSSIVEIDGTGINTKAIKKIIASTRINSCLEKNSRITDTIFK